MSDAPRHPDLLDAAGAIVYLRLDAACASVEAARRRLGVLARSGEIHPLRLGKADLFARPDLDAFVQRQIDALLIRNAPPGANT
jgi:hypothetical protein